MDEMTFEGKFSLMIIKDHNIFLDSVLNQKIKSSVAFSFQANFNFFSFPLCPDSVNVSVALLQPLFSKLVLINCNSC